MLLNSCMNLLPTQRKHCDHARWFKMYFTFYQLVLTHWFEGMLLCCDLLRSVYMKSVLGDFVCSPESGLIVCHPESEGSTETTVISLLPLGPYSFPGPALSAPNRTFITNSTLLLQPHTTRRQSHISVACRQTYNTHRYTDNEWIKIIMKHGCT